MRRYLKQVLIAFDQLINALLVERNQLPPSMRG